MKSGLVIRLNLACWGLLFNLFSLQGQSCCSGGVPLSNSLGLPVGEARSLQVNLSYDLNTLTTLKAGTRVLDDRSRNRQTHSVLLQLGYAFTDRFSVEVFGSFVRQERRIRQFGNEDFTFTQGVGDGVILLKHRVLLTASGNSLSIGLGAKLPTGASDRRDNRNILLNADLQPGSGAWDGLIWGQWMSATSFRPSLSWSLSGIYAIKGKNPNYLGSEIYQFGPELQLTFGLSDQWLIGKSLWTPGLSLRYRQLNSDEQNGETLPGTGGEWLFVAPSVGMAISPSLSVNAVVSLPLYAKVTDTQVTPTYRLTTGIYYNFSLNQ